MQLLALMTDAYGTRGGLAKFNRDLMRALAARGHRIQLLARQSDVSPDRAVTVSRLATRGRCAFVAASIHAATLQHDAVLCGHIHLLPVAGPVALRLRKPLVLFIHGIDAWEPPHSVFQRYWARRVDHVVAVSRVTRERFTKWSDVAAERAHVLHNCVELERYGPGPKALDLLEAHQLVNRAVLLTVARLSSVERYKGVDEVMEALPEIAAHVPNVTYLVVGDGDDRPRLEERAVELGVSDKVCFAGYVPDERKADYYRLADAFIMPGRGEGFGIVFLEALACGVPAIGSTLDGSRDALQDGKLGVLVHPDRRREIVAAAVDALRREHCVPDGLSVFSSDAFDGRAGELIETILEHGDSR